MANSVPAAAQARKTVLGGNEVALTGPELRVGDTAPDFSVVDGSLQAVDLAGTGSGVRIFSVVPSLDTPVCDAQTKRFEEEAQKLENVKIYTISMDLPFAQKRWCTSFGINKIAMLSDHRTGSFGESYGTLIAEARIESRAIFVIGADNVIKHVEYVPKVSDQPDYEAALRAAKS
jgi:thioredoxin-dependent peroxiredoxin